MGETLRMRAVQSPVIPVVEALIRDHPGAISLGQGVERLIREHRIAVIPDSTFGLHGHCTVRIACGALTRDTVAEGIGRFVHGLQSIAGS